MLRLRLGFMPQDVLTHGYIWQPFTYMFVHDGIFHILFNMLALWMFGVGWSGCGEAAISPSSTWCRESERRFINALVVRTVRSASTGLLHPDGRRLGSGLRRPARARDVLSTSPDLHVFRLPNTGEVYFVMIIGAISLLSSFDGSGGGIAHTTHLGGLVAPCISRAASELTSCLRSSPGT